MEEINKLSEEVIKDSYAVLGAVEGDAEDERIRKYLSDLEESHKRLDQSHKKILSKRVVG